MDTMYQRGKIQDESLYYESKKHDGSLPLIGVNTFLPRPYDGDAIRGVVGASRRSPVRWRCNPPDCRGEPPLARTMEIRSAGL
jgi:hypothetical protein